MSHDAAMLRIQLSRLPLGNYHTRDDVPSTLFRDGKPMLFLQAYDHANLSPEAIAGVVAALVHLLNTREQTEIPRE